MTSQEFKIRGTSIDLAGPSRRDSRLGLSERSAVPEPQSTLRNDRVRTRKIATPVFEGAADATAFRFRAYGQAFQDVAPRLIDPQNTEHYLPLFEPF